MDQETSKKQLNTIPAGRFITAFESKSLLVFWAEFTQSM